MTLTELLMIVLGRVVRAGHPVGHPPGHFEILSWDQVTVTIRFWIICGVCIATALGLFYAEWFIGSR